MRKTIWRILTILGVILLTACSDTEPKSTEGNGDEVPSPSNHDTTMETMAQITEGEWSGIYYYRRVADYMEYDYISSLIFNQKEGNFGIGKCYIIHDGPERDLTDLSLKRHKGYSYYFYFYIEDNKIFCKNLEEPTPTYPYYPYFPQPATFTFEYKDGLLYMSSPLCHDLVLGKDRAIPSDANGIIVDDSNTVKNKLKKVWLHENGRNILDFYHPIPRIMQLSADYNGKCDFLVEINNGFQYYYTTYQLEAMTKFNWYLFCWTIKEISDTKLVLRGFMDDFDDVYYAVPPETVPCLSYPDGCEIWGKWNVGGGKIGSNW